MKLNRDALFDILAGILAVAGGRLAYIMLASIVSHLLGEASRGAAGSLLWILKMLFSPLGWLPYILWGSLIGMAYSGLLSPTGECHSSSPVCCFSSYTMLCGTVVGVTGSISICRGSAGCSPLPSGNRRGCSCRSGLFRILPPSPFCLRGGAGLKTGSPPLKEGCAESLTMEAHHA